VGFWVGRFRCFIGEIVVLFLALVAIIKNFDLQCKLYFHPPYQSIFVDSSGQHIQNVI
jgi:hypothetical protein